MVLLYLYLDSSKNFKLTLQTLTDDGELAGCSSCILRFLITAASDSAY